MPSNEKLDTHRKALTLNLDPSTFSSFAEIGADQEVARWFLLVGGASGTVAKTISAYDKEVSDDLYGKEVSDDLYGKEVSDDLYGSGSNELARFLLRVHPFVRTC